ncbi:MAG: hypothetical protein RLY73_1049 [Pseudomonadota bacterium]|jgi:hypothetical protein
MSCLTKQLTASICDIGIRVEYLTVICKDSSNSFNDIIRGVCVMNRQPAVPESFNWSIPDSALPFDKCLNLL